MQILDNVLSEKRFDKLYESITDHSFPWHLQTSGVSVPGDGRYQFTHQFCDPRGARSPFDSLMEPMYYRLGVNKLYRCKVNLTLKTKKTCVFFPFHTDISFADGLIKPFDYSTAIFYLNTNNGYTLFEDGTKVDSVANRMVMFNGNTKHTSASHTEGDRFRFVLNINFS